MNNNTLLSNIQEVFKNRTRPKSITTHTNYSEKDYECNSIQKQFGNLELDKMTNYDAKMMLIDSTLINDEAILYYLPKLADVVINKNGDPNFLKGQLIRINKSNLSEIEINTLNKLLLKIDTIINTTD
jgi:hypothetical protein